jgi:hypothetical protein
MADPDVLKERDIFDEPFEEEASAEEPKEEVQTAPESEPEPEAEAEPEAEPKVEEPKEEKTSDKEVNFAKLRTKLEDSERNREMLAQRLDKIQQQLDIEAQQRQQQLQAQQQEHEELAFEDDPSTFLKQQNEKVQEQLSTIQQQTQQQALNAQIEAQAAGMTQQFASQQPDYPDAFAYMRDRRFKEYEAQRVPQEQWQAAWDNEAWSFTINQMNKGNNPAEIAYNMAKVYGYQPTGQTSAGNAINNPAETKIAQLEKGQQAAKSLSEDSAPEETVEGEKPIAEMTNAEFEKYFAKVEAQARKESGNSDFF